jgi:hypothetical protein
MYKTVLVKEMIEDGSRLLHRLDEQEIEVSAAAWFDDPDQSSWKLVIVTPVAGSPGPLEAYMRLQGAMAGLSLHFSLDDIIVMSPNSRKFEDFRRTIEGVTKGALLRAKASSEGVAFDDAYIYRWLEYKAFPSI